MKYKVKDINRLVYPILLNYLLNSIFEILDQAIVGHYSSQSFALVGIASSMIYAVTGAFGIMSTVFNIIAAERKGKKDEAGFESVFAINKMLTLLIGFLFFIIGCLGGKLFFRQVYGITGNDLIEMLSYFYPAAFTVVQNMLIFQYSAYYRNCFNTKITLYSTIVSTIVNLFFDYSLVFGCFGLPQLGTAGAAWGSVIGLFVGLFIYQIPYWRKHSPVIAKRMIEKKYNKANVSVVSIFFGARIFRKYDFGFCSIWDSIANGNRSNGCIQSFRNCGRYCWTSCLCVCNSSSNLCAAKKSIRK